MDIRGNLEGLRSLLGVNANTQTTASGKNGAAVESGSNQITDQITLSSAGSEVSLTASTDGVRTDKVAAIQSALAAGTYSVPASAVASKVVDSMLNGAR